MKSFDYSSKINELMTIKEKRKLLREIHDSKKRLLYSNPKVIMPFIREKLSDTLLRDSYQLKDRHSPIMIPSNGDQTHQEYLQLMRDQRHVIERELQVLRQSEEQGRKELERRMERLALSQEAVNNANVAEIRAMLKTFNDGQRQRRDDLESENPIVRDLKLLKSNYLLDGGKDTKIVQEIESAIEEARRDKSDIYSDKEWTKRRRGLAVEREKSYELRDLERQNAELVRQLDISLARGAGFTERRLRSSDSRLASDKVDLLQKQIEELKSQILSLSQPQYPEQSFHPTPRLPMSGRSGKETPRILETRNILILIDFLSGIDPNIRSIDVTLSVYHGLVKITDPISTGPLSIRPSSMANLDSTVLVDLRHPVLNCPASVDMFALIELCLTTWDNEQQEQCWTKIIFFTLPGELKIGNWQEYLYKSPVFINASQEELYSLPHYNRSILHYRITNYNSNEVPQSAKTFRNNSAEQYPKPNPFLFNETRILDIDNDDAKSDITMDLDERPDIGFQMIRVKNMSRGDGLELAKIKLTVYHTEGPQKGQIAMSSEGPVTCSTNAVRADFKMAFYNLGRQTAKFSNVDLSVDCLVYARFYLEGDKGTLSEEDDGDVVEREEILVAWTALNVVKRRRAARKNPSYFMDSLKLLKINRGIHDLPLYEPPAIPPEMVFFDKNGLIVGQKKMGTSKLKFRIFHTELLYDSSTSSDETSMDEEDHSNESSKNWIPIDRVEPPLLPYHHEDGFDLYIDSGKLFPDSVTIVKIEGSIVDRYLNYQGPLFSSITDLQSDIYNPSFKERVEVREPHLAPASTLLLKVMTFDREDKNVVVMGYAALKIFIETGTDRQPQFDDLGVLVSLNEGGHQLRIFDTEPIMSKTPFTESWFTKHHTKPIPGATLLVRIHKPPKNAEGRSININEVPKNYQVRLGVSIEAPLYEEGYYYSMSCKPLEGENKIMKAHSLRPKVFLQDLIMSKWAESLMEAVSSREVPESSQLFRLFDMFTKNVFNFNHVSHYSPMNGFKISVDGALNLPWSGYPMMHICLYPPGATYLKKPFMAYDRPHFVTKLDFQSSYSSPVWMDGWKSYRRRKYNRNLVAILHLHEMKVSIVKNDFVFSLENEAWTPVRIFDGPYCVTNSTQMPLLNGSPTLLQLQELVDKPVQQFLSENIPSKKVTPLQSSSVIIRQCDSRRQLEVSLTAENEKLILDQSFLPQTNLVAYRSVIESNKDVQFSSTIPTGFTVESFQQFLHVKFKNLIYKLYEQDGFYLT